MCSKHAARPSASSRRLHLATTRPGNTACQVSAGCLGLGCTHLTKLARSRWELSAPARPPHPTLRRKRVSTTTFTPPLHCSSPTSHLHNLSRGLLWPAGVGEAMGEAMGERLNPLERLGRTVEFWRRATRIYLGYKVTQVRVVNSELHSPSSMTSIRSRSLLPTPCPPPHMPFEAQQARWWRRTHLNPTQSLCGCHHEAGGTGRRCTDENTRATGRHACGSCARASG
jgi:hypothetical protein